MRGQLSGQKAGENWNVSRHCLILAKSSRLPVWWSSHQPYPKSERAKTLALAHAGQVEWCWVPWAERPIRLPTGEHQPSTSITYFQPWGDCRPCYGRAGSLKLNQYRGSNMFLFIQIGPVRLPTEKPVCLPRWGVIDCLEVWNITRWQSQTQAWQDLY